MEHDQLCGTVSHLQGKHKFTKVSTESSEIKRKNRSSKVVVEWREEAESHFQVLFKTTHGRDNRKSAGSGLLLKHKGEDMCMHFLFRSVLFPVFWYSEYYLGVSKGFAI